VQVAPIKLNLNLPGNKPLKLEHEKLLSNFASKFNLRRYKVVAAEAAGGTSTTMVGRYSLTV